MCISKSFTVGQKPRFLSDKLALFVHFCTPNGRQHYTTNTKKVFSPLLPELASDPANGRSRNGWPDNGAALPAMVVPHRFHSVPTASDFAHVDAVHNSTAVYETMVQANRPESALKLLQEKLNIRTEMGKEKEEGRRRRRQQHTSGGGGHNGKRAESQPVVSDFEFEGGGGGSSSSSGGEGGGVSGALLGASTAGGVGTYVDVNAYQVVVVDLCREERKQVLLFWRVHTLIRGNGKRRRCISDALHCFPVSVYPLVFPYPFLLLAPQKVVPPFNRARHDSARA
jgi:hypothetical protein